MILNAAHPMTNFEIQSYFQNNLKTFIHGIIYQNL